MKKKYFFIVSALVCVTLVIAVSCGKNSNNPYGSTGGGGGATNPNGITMSNMTFSPANKTVAKGTVVTWTNNDPYAHTVTSNDGTSFNSGNINGGGNFSYTASVVGTFDYHCLIHGTAMSGTLTVTP